MNNTYYENLDQNFTNALNFYETNYSHEQLIDMLKNGNIVQKQISALKLESINSSDDANILLSNLTGQDGKIREAVSLRLSEFMGNDNYIKYFEPSKNTQKFLDAIIDINGNICRNVIQAISNLREDENFCKIFCEKLANLTLELLEVVEKFDFQDGKYKVNKEAFKLYWCLETVYVFWDKMDFTKLKEILQRGSNIGEYTIREKCAKILTHDFKDKDLAKIKEKLKNDSNYYVRRF
ncbi:hypothetical protein IJ674_02960 [bacterium]|nr:hypothetical protein [bacterium]